MNKKVLDALKNVTQARGYTAAEEATARGLLAKHEPKPEPVMKKPVRKSSSLEEFYRIWRGMGHKGSPCDDELPLKM